MPENQAADFISQGDYDTYIDNWLALVASTDATALPQAFQVPEVNRINFLNFSIDQVTALTAPDVALIKARFLAIPDAADIMRFSTALFGLDADGKRLTEYYVPLPPQAGPPTTQPTGSAAGAGTHITRKLTVEWLTAWDDTPTTSALFNVLPNATLRGYNFEVSALKDPLAAAQPTAGKGLYLNLGLHQDPYSPELAHTLDLVFYINTLGSRAQGTLAGLPEDESFYNAGMPCPPNATLS
jgi:hypothetical protein